MGATTFSPQATHAIIKTLLALLLTFAAATAVPVTVEVQALDSTSYTFTDAPSARPILKIKEWLRDESGVPVAEQQLILTDGSLEEPLADDAEVGALPLTSTDNGQR